ncbi:MAG: hypothetical protein GX286_00920 [Clostridiales bacterium]|nr:hypothetical protein [Clostridiales bacterium]
MEEEIKFNVDNVDISDKMTQIHKRIEARGYEMDKIKMLRNFTIKNKAENYPDSSDGNLFPLANMVSNCSRVQYWWSIQSEPGLRNKFRAFRYKVTRKFMFFYMKYVMEQQITFNEGVAHTINALVEKNEKLERENKELYKCIAVLTKEVDSIRKSIRK